MDNSLATASTSLPTSQLLPIRPGFHSPRGNNTRYGGHEPPNATAQT
jgi:hypothetical protein